MNDIQIRKGDKIKRESVECFVRIGYNHFVPGEKVSYPRFLEALTNHREYIKELHPHVKDDAIFIVPNTVEQTFEVELEYWVKRMETREETALRVKTLEEEEKNRDLEAEEREKDIAIMEALAIKLGYKVRELDAW